MIPRAEQMVCLVEESSNQQLQELWFESPAIAESEAKLDVVLDSVFCPSEEEVVRKVLLRNSEYC